ncbi:MAG: S9 family peptidase, partial [Chitinophagaceae bacterium]
MIKHLITATMIASALTASAQKDSLSSKEYERAEKFLAYNTESLVSRNNVRPVWLPGDKLWYMVTSEKGNEFILVDAAKKTRTPAFDHTKVAAALGKATGKTYDAYKLPFVFITPSDDGKTIGFTAEGKTWSYDLKANTLQAGTGTAAAPQQQMGRRGGGNEVLSPDGKKAVFIRNWNLWVRDVESKKETQLTTDGIENFGYATDNAGWTMSDRPVVKWSPDSKKVSTFQQDQRHVGDMYLVTTNVGKPVLKAWKYPLPGDSEIVKIHRVIIDVESGKMVRLQIPPDPHRATLSDDISSSGSFDDNDWKADGSELAFLSSSRDHKQAKFRIADANTGAVRDVFEEVVKTQFESGRGAINWRYLPASGEILWYSERDDWGHLYLYDAKTGNLKHQITKGEFVVARVVDVNEKARQIIFTAVGREPGNPYFQHLYKIGFDGKNLVHLTPAHGSHTIALSPSKKFFVDTYSQPDTPAVTVVRNMAGKIVTELERADISKLVASGWKAPKPVKVKAGDGKTDIFGLVFTPTIMEAGKKYPVIDYIYPGPQGGSVGSWSFVASRGDHQALAELGFIVVLIEGTSNPYRSKSYHDMNYGNMAENTLPDQVAAIRQ